ncbi:hypothetical protein B0G80_7406 [Paraburkholderia sp. BL6669N2]|nr:hypothetical protein B0G80_7406 [Paraburkholderia sp. BL6669N2]
MSTACCTRLLFQMPGLRNLRKRCLLVCVPSQQAFTIVTMLLPVVPLLANAFLEACLVDDSSLCPDENACQRHIIRRKFSVAAN